jgi:hypothetical protein
MKGGDIIQLKLTKEKVIVINDDGFSKLRVRLQNHDDKEFYRYEVEELDSKVVAGNTCGPTTISVNGTFVCVLGEIITYESVLEVAGYFPTEIVSVVFTKGKIKRSLIQGQSVFVEDDLKITAIRTDNA